MTRRLSSTALRRSRQFGPQQVGEPGQEDEGHLVDHAQEDGQETRQVLQRGDGEFPYFRLLLSQTLSPSSRPNHILRAEDVYDTI